MTRPAPGRPALRRPAMRATWPPSAILPVVEAESQQPGNFPKKLSRPPPPGGQTPSISHADAGWQPRVFDSAPRSTWRPDRRTPFRSAWRCRTTLPISDGSVPSSGVIPGLRMVSGNLCLGRRRNGARSDFQGLSTGAGPSLAQAPVGRRWKSRRSVTMPPPGLRVRHLRRPSSLRGAPGGCPGRGASPTPPGSCSDG